MMNTFFFNWCLYHTLKWKFTRIVRLTVKCVNGNKAPVAVQIDFLQIDIL